MKKMWKIKNNNTHTVAILFYGSGNFRIIHTQNWMRDKERVYACVFSHFIWMNFCHIYYASFSRSNRISNNFHIFANFCLLSTISIKFYNSFIGSSRFAPFGLNAASIHVRLIMTRHTDETIAIDWTHSKENQIN